MPQLGVAVAVAAAGLAAGLLFAAGIEYAGPKGAMAPLAAAVGLVLLRFPGVTFGLTLGLVALAETEPIGALPSGEVFYGQVLGSLTGPDLMIAICLAGVLLRCAEAGERPRLPEPLVAALLLLAAALAFGVISGAGATEPASAGDLFHRGAHLGYLIVLPFLAVNVISDTRALKTFVGLLAALAAIKGVTGLYSALAGSGATVEDEVATFLSPLPNLLTLTLVLGVAAALVRRVRLPAWAYAAAPLALLALVLSYRRSFWIALAIGLVLVLIIASRRRGRALVAVGAAALALALGAALTVGSSSDSPSPSPLAERARTLAPGNEVANRGDRYRSDERSNVLRNIEQHPITGIGLGVNWSVSQPLAEDHDRRYAHIAVLWYWLALGILGVAAYLLLMGRGLWTATQIWRRHADPLVQTSAIAAFGLLVGLLAVELTATFTGFETRVSLGLGAGLGWLAAAWRDLPKRVPS